MPVNVSDRLIAAVAAAACLLAGAYLAVDARQEADLRKANELGLDGNYAAAFAKAGAVTRRPALTRALVVRGVAALARNRLRPAVANLGRAVRYDPNDWALRRHYGIALLRLGERQRAQTQMARALALNPTMALPLGFTR